MAQLGEVLSSVRLDTDFLPQARLDLGVKERTSLYPWRGQFSPLLVEALLAAYADRGSLVVDPFVGSGTTLFEAARAGLECIGLEVNPAAAALAGMARFASRAAEERQHIIRAAAALIECHLGEYLPRTLFRKAGQGACEQAIEPQRVRELVSAAGARDGLASNVLVASVMLAMGDGDVLTGAALDAAFARNRAIVTGLPYSPRPCQVLLGDARRPPLADGTVGVVITSPPYINVFNYHQNYRRAMETLGWNLLEIARSEIGANRKHRGNRFLTVIQFCMDLAQALGQVRRVLHDHGRAVFVIGRESQVRGVAFGNGELLAYLAVKGGGLRLERRQERKFVNRFGNVIYEEVITLRPAGQPIEDLEAFGRTVGRLALERAVPAAHPDVLPDLRQALDKSSEVRASPLLVVADEDESFVARRAASA